RSGPGRAPPRARARARPRQRRVLRLRRAGAPGAGLGVTRMRRSALAMNARIGFAGWLVAAAIAGPARAWDPAEHRRIVDLATDHAPPRLAVFLRAHHDDVECGALDPDRKFMDTENHTYEVADGSRRNPDRVAEVSASIVSMLRNGAPRERVAYAFGVLSH